MSENLASVRCLSVRRPWANLIVAGPKRIENRTWTTDYRGPLVIHAGKTWDAAGASMAGRLGVDAFDTAPQCPTGYVGVVELLDIHAADGCCPMWGEAAPGIYHWLLGSPIAFPEPVSGGGRLNLYASTDPELLTAIARAVRKSAVPQVNPIVAKAAAGLRKNRKRDLRESCAGQLSLFNPSEGTRS